MERLSVLMEWTEIASAFITSYSNLFTTLTLMIACRVAPGWWLAQELSELFIFE